MEKKDLKLYAITDSHWLNGETLAEQVEKALKGGATCIQLREKTLGEEKFYNEAIEIQKVCKKYKVPFIINDNVELAAKIGADGVHVGQKDMEALSAREKLGPDKIIGVSARTVEQAMEAEKNGASYLGVGAVFQTGTKTDAKVITKQTLQEISAAVSIPIIAIGGITEDKIEQLEGTGIVGVAVISAIFAKEDIEQATQSILNKVDTYITKE